MMPEPTPLRPDEQVAGGFLDMSLGGSEYTLTELPTGLNREFRKRHGAVMDVIVSGIGQPTTLADVAEQVNAHSEAFMDLLLSYDADGGKVLPDRKWIDTHATDGEIYSAVRQVTAVAFPFGSNLLDLALMQAAQKVRSSLRSTSGSRPSTAGPRKRSKPA